MKNGDVAIVKANSLASIQRNTWINIKSLDLSLSFTEALTALLVHSRNTLLGQTSILKYCNILITSVLLSLPDNLNSHFILNTNT